MNCPKKNRTIKVRVTAILSSKIIFEVPNIQVGKKDFSNNSKALLFQGLKGTFAVSRLAPRPNFRIAA